MTAVDVAASSSIACLQASTYWVVGDSIQLHSSCDLVSIAGCLGASHP